MLRRTFLFGATAALAAREAGEDPVNAGSVAYMQNGVLWIRRLPNGIPRALATGAAIYAPRFSPSRRWILFNDGDDLLGLVSTDGVRSKTWVGSRAGEWMPQGDRLVINQTTMWSADNDWTAPVINYTDPVGTLSRDGRRHAWVSSEEGEKRRLFVGSFGSTYERKLVAETGEADQGGFAIFSFIRGGNRFLYWTTDEDGADVWSYGMDIWIGGGPHPVNTGVSTLVAGAWGRMVVLSPAEDVLAAAVGDDHLLYQDHTLVVADISRDAESPVVKITPPSVHVLNPAWSPDGRRLAWAQGPDANVLGQQLMEHDDRLTWGEVWNRAIRARRIWLADGGGLGQPVQLTDDSRYSDDNPLWSRDGKYILFVRTDEQASRALWLMQTDGTGQQEVAGPLTAPPAFDQPQFDWSFASQESAA
jgi:dipeptidyl aminopeptidase/acylaminoacyl peptidase